MKQVGAWLVVLAAAISAARMADHLSATQGPEKGGAPEGTQLASITIDYPENGSLFPPDISAPTFIWRDSAAGATSWSIQVTFADASPLLNMQPQAERMRTGRIDPRCISRTSVPPKLTPQQPAARTWTADVVTWRTIKRHSVDGGATLTITGFGVDGPGKPLSRGQVIIQTSKDPVGAPIFYRDVPLMPSELEKGMIKQPLPEPSLLLSANNCGNTTEAGSSDRRPPRATRPASEGRPLHRTESTAWAERPGRVG